MQLMAQNSSQVNTSAAVDPDAYTSPRTSNEFEMKQEKFPLPSSDLNTTSHFMVDQSIDLDTRSAHDLELSLDHDKDESQVKTTLATKAIDELYVLIVSLCNVVEMFFQPYYPKEVTYDLHPHFMMLC